jgi:hypothetical protein
VRVSSHDLLELHRAVQSGSAANGKPLARDTRPDGLKRSGGWQHSKWDGAREEAMEWLKDWGCPESGDGNQAKLSGHIASWLENQGYDAGEASIRRHVTRWIKEYREFSV